ncbi:cell division protein ZipA [Halomonas sp. DN3]|uniref:cell division protein ZipA n=1 Tax=Halomonas sp. DN3 TaxID=2953657 RepID=UPI00209FBC46|nr:cell division protein ZipA [Halomonas sp. DN3]USZ49127.1 cell division protein ZipA [Halomonas sp. DN3]
MELREWLIILGLALVTLIVIDGARRLQRQRRTPRLDEVQGDVLDSGYGSYESGYGSGHGSRHDQEPAMAASPGPSAPERREVASVEDDPEERARQEEINWELPNGGARVVRPADFSNVQPKPKLQRQEHPGPSRVLSEFRSSQASRAQEAGDSHRADGSSTNDRPADTVAPRASQPAPAARAEQPTQAEGEEKVAEKGAEQAPAEAEPTPAQAEPSVRVDKAPAQAPNAENAEEVAEQSSLTDEPMAADSHEEPRATSETTMDAPVDADASTGKAAQDEHAVRDDVADAGDGRREPSLSARRDDDVASEPGDAAMPSLAADPQDHEEFDEDQYRLVDFEGMGDSLKDRSRRMGSSVHRFGASLQKSLGERREQKRIEREKREKERAEKARLKAEQKAEQAKLKAEEEARRQAEQAQHQAEQQRQRQQEEGLRQEQAAQEAERRRQEALLARQAAADQRGASSMEDEASFDDATYDEAAYDEAAFNEAADANVEDSRVRTHPVLEKALRHDVNAEHARDSLSNAEEIIVISVMSRDEDGFPGTTLLELMMACGLRYSRDMGIFHRFETEDEGSALQFSMVNVLKPGTFPIEAMDDFTTPGITLLMPLPSAKDSSAAFEAMVETAMVIVRHMGGELKDENHSVMTAQTVEFARQRVQEFERRHRLHRYQVN